MDESRCMFAPLCGSMLSCFRCVDVPRRNARGGGFLGLVLDRMVSVFAARINFLYEVSLYVCLSGVMCGDVLQALIVIILSFTDTVPILSPVLVVEKIALIL